jgi:hypothetical protein
MTKSYRGISRSETGRDSGKAQRQDRRGTRRGSEVDVKNFENDAMIRLELTSTGKCDLAAVNRGALIGGSSLWV